MMMQKASLPVYRELRRLWQDIERRGHVAHGVAVDEAEAVVVELA